MANETNPPEAELSAAQQEIMEIIWKHGELSASEIREIVNKDRPVSRNTIRTLLERMQAKGWLQYRPIGRTFLYSAAIPRQESIGRKLVDFVDNFCEGSAESLVSALLNYRGVSSQELKRIRAMLEQAKSKPQRSDK